MWETFHGVSLTARNLLDFTQNVLDNFVHYRSTCLFNLKLIEKIFFYQLKHVFS